MLAVRDALGREIVRLVDGWQKAGAHRISFDAGAVPGGIYYYTLSSGRFFDAKKMIVTK